MVRVMQSNRTCAILKKTKIITSNKSDPWQRLFRVTFFCCVSVPGGSDGPSGVLICSENYITYKNFGDQPDIRCPIPRRRVRAPGFLPSPFCETILVGAERVLGVCLRREDFKRGGRVPVWQFVVSLARGHTGVCAA